MKHNQDFLLGTQVKPSRPTKVSGVLIFIPEYILNATAIKTILKFNVS